MNRVILCIDLKTFFASVECSLRGLDTYKDNLVVADPSRGNGAICLAITQHMKDLGIHNRCRIFEIPKSVSYIVALPQMKKYIEFSCKIYDIYLRYLSKDDIHTYSIDEMFLDVTNYLKLYKMTSYEMAVFLMKKIYDELKIYATCGIGTNLFLAKVALDIKAKHASNHIGILDEESFKKEYWFYKPLTDFWMIAGGTERRLKKLGLHTLFDVAHAKEDDLYKEFGVNAEILIDHSKGIESVNISDIKAYKSKSKSISQGQVLFSDYNYNDALLVLKEMVELLSLTLVEKKVVSDNISLYVGYSKDEKEATGGSMKLCISTNVYTKLCPFFVELYKKTTYTDVSIRRINISFNNVKPEYYEYFDLFTDPMEIKQERELENTINAIKKRYGKNSILKAMNLEKKATTMKRNKLIGGHNAEREDEDK